MPRPLYFLAHEGNPAMFSGYGIPLNDGEKSPLVGMMFAEGTEPSTEQYIQEEAGAYLTKLNKHKNDLTPYSRRERDCAPSDSA